jgi:hypothetical protein
LIFLLTFGCGERSDDVGGGSIFELPPGDGEISGWSRDGSLTEATNYAALYDLIDGGAQKFIDNGFVSAVFQNYKDESGLRLEVRVYQLSSEENARKIYDELIPPSTIPWDELAESGRIDTSTLATYSVEFQYRDLFVQVIIHEKSDRSLEIAKLFASHILERAREIYG